MTSGIYEGRSDEEGWRRYNEVLEELFIKDNFDARIEGGESFSEIEARFVPFIESLTEQYADREGRLILVGHGGTYRCMLAVILPNLDFSFTLNNHIPNTSYVLAELGEGGFFCRKWGDIEFSE